jgi:hypothetical protein
VTEPRLRRLLSRPDFRSYARQEERKTRTGTRTATVIPVRVLPDFRAALEKEAGSNGQREREQKQPEAFASIAAAYETVLREKEARIADLQTALEHEREQSRRLAEALAREQTLRALPSPSPQTAARSTHDDAVERDAESVGQITPWWKLWERWFGRKE